MIPQIAGKVCLTSNANFKMSANCRDGREARLIGLDKYRNQGGLVRENVDDRLYQVMHFDVTELALRERVDRGLTETGLAQALLGLFGRA